MLYGLQMNIVTDHLNKNDKKKSFLNTELFLFFALAGRGQYQRPGPNEGLAIRMVQVQRGPKMCSTAKAQCWMERLDIWYQWSETTMTTRAELVVLMNCIYLRNKVNAWPQLLERASENDEPFSAHVGHIEPPLCKYLVIFKNIWIFLSYRASSLQIFGNILIFWSYGASSLQIFGNI